MKYYLSMDGGGTKTAWLLTEETGRTAARYLSDGLTRPMLGVPEVLERINAGIDRVLSMANAARSDLLAAAFGIPCFDEYPEEDREILSALEKSLAPAAVTAKNDVELAFAGSLCLGHGIHLVAGTGAIAIGRNAAGQSARAGGWHPEFSDAGSGYWLGMQTLCLFTKQADQRVPKGPLYDIIRRELSLRDDMDIAAYYENHLQGDRKKVAAIQMHLYEAAAAGDASALELYRAAAQELYEAVCGVRRALAFSGDETVRISYSGGLFAEGSFVLPALREMVGAGNAVLVPPALSPLEGGILLAAQLISQKQADTLCHDFLSDN